MKTYKVQDGDTFKSIGKKLGVSDGYALRTYHNLYCKVEDLMHSEPIPGKTILVPEETQEFDAAIELDNTPTVTGNKSVRNNEQEDEQPKENPIQQSADDKQEEKNKKGTEDSGKSEHDGKYFVISQGKAKCNQGVSFPNFKVTSHQKHYWNDAEGQSDYLAVTEDDLQFTPPAQPFGAQCNLQPSGSSYLPCSYAPAGKWQKCYDKVKVMGKSCLTEISELQCVIGGKITVLKHGQQSEMGKAM